MPDMRRRSALAASAVIAAGLMFSGAALAQASTAPNGGLPYNTTFAFINSQTNYCLYSTTDIHTGVCNSANASDQWQLKFNSQGNGSYVWITNNATGDCLDTYKSNPSVLYIGYCNGDDGGAQWHVLAGTRGGDANMFQNNETGYVVDSNQAGDAYGHVGNGGTWQNWFVVNA